MRYDIKYTSEAAKEMLAIGQPVRMRVMKVAEKLRNWPDVSGVKPMSGNLAGHWRLRVADKYRILFRVEENTVLIISVGHRDGFYG